MNYPFSWRIVGHPATANRHQRRARKSSVTPTKARCFCLWSPKPPIFFDIPPARQPGVSALGTVSRAPWINRHRDRASRLEPGPRCGSRPIQISRSRRSGGARGERSTPGRPSFPIAPPHPRTLRHDVRLRLRLPSVQAAAFRRPDISAGIHRGPRAAVRAGQP